MTDKYKLISGRLHEHFGFKLLTDVNVQNVDKGYCVHWEKSFAYHAMFPLSVSFVGQCHSVCKVKKNNLCAKLHNVHFLCNILQNLLCGYSKLLCDVCQISAQPRCLKGTSLPWFYHFAYILNQTYTTISETSAETI